MKTSPSAGPPPKKPLIQFSLTTLMVVMVVASLACAPGYYLMRAHQGQEGMQLIGMIVLLTGPMFLAILLSLGLSFVGWWNRQ